MVRNFVRIFNLQAKKPMQIFEQKKKTIAETLRTLRFAES
jgi:hypothetical protein